MISGCKLAMPRVQGHLNRPRACSDGFGNLVDARFVCCPAGCILRLSTAASVSTQKQRTS